MNSAASNRDDVPRTRRARLQEIFRDETNGGISVMVAAIIAIVWANSPWSHSYLRFINLEIGSSTFNLTIAHWASDLLLAVFFFVVGIELKHEMTFGSLSSIRRALIPTSAALGGMLCAGTIFYFMNANSELKSAWAIPISTDVAFALALLALVGKSLSQELRVFLLTLAVVNDLAAISVIAIFYGEKINWIYLAISAAAVTLFALVQRSSVTSLAIYIPLAAISWIAMQESGIHATVAGVALGLVMRNRVHNDESAAPAAHAEHVLRPFSAGFCVPMFAFVTAGISVAGVNISEVISSSLVQGIALGLVIGQPVGILLATKLATFLTKTKLPKNLFWLDVWVIGSLASIGFTVALLVSEVSFATDEKTLLVAKFGVLLSNVLAMAVATIVIKIRAKLTGKNQG